MTNLNSPPLFKNEEKDFSNTHFPLYHIINKENVIINNYEGISTDFLSKKKQEEQNTNNEPLLYSFDNILDILQKNENKDKFKEIVKKINNEESKQQMKLLEKKRKRNFNDDEDNYLYELMNKQNDNIIIDKNEQNNKKMVERLIKHKEEAYMIKRSLILLKRLK